MGLAAALVVLLLLAAALRAGEACAQEQPRLRGSLMVHAPANDGPAPRPEAEEPRDGATGSDGRAQSLRGALTEGGATTTISIASGLGYTTNAGPALDKVSSPVVVGAAEMVHVRKSADATGRVELAVSDREFLQRPEVGTHQFKLAAKYETRGTDGQLSVSAAAEQHADVDENLAQAGLTFEYRVGGGGTSPFLRATIDYLDYGPIPGGFLEQGNQNDRDRSSGSLLAGISRDLSSHWALKGGLGADIKRYTSSYDDFGLDRDNASLFPFFGVTFADAAVVGEVFYAPVWRRYRQPEFGSLMAHTVNARVEWQPSSAWKVFAAARRGLEETDFFIAKGVEESVVTFGGVVALTGGASIGAVVAYTRSSYLDLERTDEKLEALLQGKVPVDQSFFLTCEARYMRFASTFAALETDAVTVTAGLTYQITR